MTEQAENCKHCDTAVTGKFCTSCGQKIQTERLSVSSISHEVFHFFTHLDHGLPYTIKRLFSSPGTMQKEYIEGYRTKYQKPFSMYFLCGTFVALVMYWVNLLLIAHFGAGDDNEAIFFHKYWVILQIVMMPFYALITYLFFRRSKLNYGEILIFQLYLFSALFILLSAIHLLKLVFPHLETRYVELPVIILYTMITNFNFFKGMNKWFIIGITVVTITVNFFVASYVQDLLVELFSKTGH